MDDKACDDVQWSSLGYAIRRLSVNDKTRIIKLINGWLPVNDFLSVQPLSPTASCPTCNHSKEDTTHFLGCSHESRKDEWDQCTRNLQSLFLQSNTDKELSKLLLNALKAGQNDQPVEYNDLSPALQQVAKAQEHIGWQQILFGRFSQHWGIVYEQLWKLKHGNDHAPPLASEVWIAQVIKIIWQRVLSIWNLRNDDKHGSSQDKPTRQRLLAQVQSLYNQQSQIPAQAQGIFHISRSDMMLKSNNEIEAWLTYATAFVQQQPRVRKKQEAAGLRDI